MASIIDKKRLNSMSAWIKYYDDGSEVLQSYATDVVKKTPTGEFIRLWDGWSPSTNKQVYAYCGHSFRRLPFADGHYENIKPVYKRNGLKYDGLKKPLTLAEVQMDTKNFWRNIKNKQFHWAVKFDYNTACNKELRKEAKSEKRKRLLDALYSCATKKPTKNAIGVLAKMYNYDMKELWANGLTKDWGELKNY